MAEKMTGRNLLIVRKLASLTGKLDLNKYKSALNLHGGSGGSGGSGRHGSMVY